MEKITILFACMLFFNSSNIIAQWEMRYPPQPTNGINDICFVNQSVGFAVNGSGSILKTIDGGLNWNI